MPGEKPNALQTLLIEKYGVPEDEAAEYAAEIITDQKGQGKLTGDHGKYLQEEALANVANDTLGNIKNLRLFQAMAQLPEDKRALYPDRNADYRDTLNKSAGNTMVEANRVTREREGAKLSPAEQHAKLVEFAQAYSDKLSRDAQPADPSIVREADRAGNIGKWAADVKPLPFGSGYESNYAPLGGGTALVPLNEPRVEVSAQPNQFDAYTERLKKAAAMRGIILPGAK